MRQQAVAFPNVPQGQVTFAAVSSESKEVLRALRQLHIEPLPVEKSGKLDGPVRSHADMRLHYLGDGEVVVEQGDEALFRACERAGLRARFAARAPEKRYPKDIGLNCFVLGNRLIGLLEAIDPAVRDGYLARGFQPLCIRQGYARCAAAIISQRALITADPSLAALSQYGFDCLQISPGHIALPGYAYGFLGGACFLSSPHTLCFLGDLSAHPDAGRIHAFCQKHEVEPRSVLPGALRDVGSVLPLRCNVIKN